MSLAHYNPWGEVRDTPWAEARDADGKRVHVGQKGGAATKRRSAGGEAFTLIELLVVISVLALLAALLLPSLRRARERARTTVCGVHLRALGTSWEVYSIDFGSPPQLARRGIDINWFCAEGSVSDCQRYERVSVPGFGPETFETYETAGNDWQVWLSAFYYRNMLFQVSNPPPEGPLPGHWWNWGLLWESGVVEDPRAFFCPSMRHPLYAWQTPYNPWPPSFETMWRPDNPHWVNHTASSYERRAGLSGVPWDQIPPQTALGHDLGAPRVALPGDVDAGDDTPRELAHRDGGNVAYRDGHVAYLKSRFFQTWWDPATDEWDVVETRGKFLAYQYWLDREGRWTPPGLQR